jgi:hypothetical protein
MKRWLALGLVMSAGCGPAEPVVVAEPPPPETTVLLPSNWIPQTGQVVDLATASRECTLLIGSINAGLAHATEVGQKTADKGGDTFYETALALESVVRAIESQTYTTPDLLRLGGFFLGIAKNQALVLREISATPEGDLVNLRANQERLGLLYQQEDSVLGELNLLCRGQARPSELAPIPTAPIPTAPVPTAPVPTVPVPPSASAPTPQPPR